MGSNSHSGEISGLPRSTSPDFTALQAARQQFQDSIEGNIGSKYIFFETTRVKVSGSLFYDIDHPPGDVGPEGFQPETAWEIHPITSFKVIQ